MPGRIKKLQRAIAEEIKIVIELQPVVTTSRQKIVQNKDPSAVGVGPIGVLQFVSADQKFRIGEVSQTPGVVEVRVRENHVLHVRRLVADALDLLVQGI